MNFSEVIGQEQVKAHLLHLISTQKIPHSLLLCGESGSGKMALALAFASFLLGDNDENNVSQVGTPRFALCFSCYKA